MERPVQFSLSFKMVASKILCLLACVVAASNAEHENFIVGGAIPNPGQFPHLVSLRSPDNQHFCGAGILSDRWFISAAHCTQTYFANPVNVFAWVGAHSRFDGVRHAIAQIVNHPRYHEQWLLNDICVLRAQDQIQWVQHRVHPGLLPTADYTDGLQVNTWIAGWGLTQVKIQQIRKVFNFLSDEIANMNL